MKHLVSLLVVGALLGFLGAAAAAPAACGTSGAVTAVSVLNDVETACVAAMLAESIIPAGTLPSAVAPDVALACDLAEAAIPDVERIIATFMTIVNASQSVDAGVAARARGLLYRPAAWAVPKIAARRAAHAPR